MPTPPTPARPDPSRRARRRVRRAFGEFLAVPTLIISGFLLLALLAPLLESADYVAVRDVRRAMQRLIFRDSAATRSLLSTVATGLLTVASITFSLILLAVQQSAAALSSQVYDQFLRRRLNQVFFGFFVGLTLYSLAVLTVVDPTFNPVLAASLALVLTATALYFLVVLIYSAIDQARPFSIVETIHDHSRRAQERHRAFLHRTHRRPSVHSLRVAVRTRDNGFIANIDVDAIASAASRCGEGVQVVLTAPVGGYVAFENTIAEIRGATGEVGGLERAILAAVSIERTRVLEVDPAYGVEQLTTIAWTTISTSKQNLSPGREVIFTLRDLLSRWSQVEETSAVDRARVPIVYDDDLVGTVVTSLEALGVVASESMQHQCYAEVLRSFAVTFERLSPGHRSRVEDAVLRLLSALGDLVLTAELDSALRQLADTLRVGARPATATAVEKAREELARSIGTLNSRSTRVATSGSA